MGARGRNATPKPQPKPNGRPRATAPEEIVAAAVVGAVESIAYARRVVADENIETKDRLRAATLLLEYATRPAREEAPEETQPKPMEVVVNYKGDYRASTG
jgi:hypothetical protein